MPPSRSAGCSCSLLTRPDTGRNNRSVHGTDECGAVPSEIQQNATVPSGAKRLVFVTGAPAKVVARPEAPRSGLKRPFRDAKRAAAT